MVNGDADNDTVNLAASLDLTAGTVTVNTGDGEDTTNIRGIGGTTTVNAGANDDIINVFATGTGGTGTATQLTLRGDQGADVVNIQTLNDVTLVQAGNDSDTINVGNQAAGTLASRSANGGGNVQGIRANLTINGDLPTSGSDHLNVDNTGDSADRSGTLTSTTLSGLDMGGTITYGTIEHLLISLGSGSDTFTIESTHKTSDPAALAIGFQKDTTLRSGGGDDQVVINSADDLLVVEGQADNDTITVNGTNNGSNSTLRGDGGNDTFNIRAMNGTVLAEGGTGSDTTNVGNLAPARPTADGATAPTGVITAINGLLTVDGGNDDASSDQLNVDDSAAANAKSAILDQIDTSRFSLRGMELEQGINYLNLETFNLWMGAAGDHLLVNATHGTTTNVFSAAGADQIQINDADGQLTIYAEAGDDVIGVRGTGLGSTVTIYGQAGSDQIHISDYGKTDNNKLDLATATLLPAAYPGGLQGPGIGGIATPVASRIGQVDGVQGLVVIDGGAAANESDVLLIDDSGNTTAKAATLTSNSLRGLGLGAGLDYTHLESLKLSMGTGADVLLIDSTHQASTEVFGGDGTEATNRRDDTIAINTIGGLTTIHGQAGNDVVEVNVQGDPSGGIFTRTNSNGLAALLNLHGESGSDLTTVNLAGTGSALVNVFDNGAPDSGVDALIINGTEEADTFLGRQNFVALLNGLTSQGFTNAERVNYDKNINARLRINGLGGDDKIVMDDNSSITTLDGGEGADTFQIGQIFGTLRDARAGVQPGDSFDVTPVIIGLIRDPETNEIIFNPVGFDPVTDVLSAETRQKIIDAIAASGDQPLQGIAYVSRGVSYATTIFGGDGNDTFNVYRNEGTLRMEGEDDNDTFVIRAFVTIDTTDKQGESEVKGGDGEDSITYAINAPVNIDGGAGFDTVVVLGTPFNDSFVVTRDGIFGAGLNVRFENIEQAELDALEGDDKIFILSTNEDVVTKIIGGLGSDQIQVMGDVTAPIVSAELQAISGLITHTFSSTDSSYATVGAPGVDTLVSTPSTGALVSIEQATQPLLVSEAGLLSGYSIRLLEKPKAGEPVYLTVSAGPTSTADQAIGGRSLLLRRKGVGTFTSALVLSFDDDNWNQAVELEIQAENDSAPEGERIALISHSIISLDQRFDGLALKDVYIKIIDNDKAGLDIRPLDADHSGFSGTTTEVLEGANGFTDQYSVSLTAAPKVGETVTVTLNNGIFTSTNTNTLIFTSADWDTAQTVTVSGVENSKQDGKKATKIKHTLSSVTGDGSDAGNYANIAASFDLDVTVYDDDVAQLIVQESDGFTAVNTGTNGGDAYRVRLTKLPTQTVNLKVETDTTTIIQGAVADPYSTTISFDSSTYKQWSMVGINANPTLSLSAEARSLKKFATRDQNLDQIQGALVIEGGRSDIDRSFAAPVLLPGETNVPSKVELLNTNEWDDIDSLTIFHTDNSDADTGKLSYRTQTDQSQNLSNPGLALTGLGMGDDIRVNEGTDENPVWRYYGGGITFNGFETTDILLGKGNETLIVETTADRDEATRDEVNTDLLNDPRSIMAIHGGGGDDTITINDRGEGALIVYGDSSQDRLRYNNSTGAASASGTSFNNPGNDRIDASAMQAKADGYVGLVIDGGEGNDNIKGSQGADQLTGNSGDDGVDGQAGDDHIYGDAAFNLNLRLFAEDQQPNRKVQNYGLSNDAAMFTVLTSPEPGSDNLLGGDGQDVILADQGILTLAAGVRRINTTAEVERIETSVEGKGGSDTINGGGGDDIALGGFGADTIALGAGNDIALGDNGELIYDLANQQDPATLKAVRTTYVYKGGDDVITGNAGDDILIGGFGNDQLFGGNGSAGAALSGSFIDADLLIGDNAELLDVQTLSTLRAASITTTDVANETGGDDIIEGNEDDDIILGGVGHDVIDGNAGRDHILGDQGVLTSRAAGVSTNPRFRSLAGSQLYETTGPSAGQSVLTLTEYSGPSGDVPKWSNWTTTIGDGQGGLFGNDYIAGGAGNDQIFGQSGDDRIQGDGSIASRVAGSGVDYQRDAAGLVSVNVASFEAASDGDDYIEGNAGNDLIYGNLGQDDIIGGSSNLFGLSASSQRTDGADRLFGGAGTDTARNDLGDHTVNNGHALDADAIVGDNGTIFRIVGAGGTANAAQTLNFNYDDYNSATGSANKIVVRSIQLLDYTPGGSDFNAETSNDLGAADELHGESGDDFLYAGKGNDVIFGEGQDDDIVGGYGNDWISGGTGDDGVIGDDGRLFTSRNGKPEPLNGVMVAVTPAVIATGGNMQQATINIAGQLKKAVDLSPFSQDPNWKATADEFALPNAGGVGQSRHTSDDIIFGGWGNDFLHGGSGDDAISGAEALQLAWTQLYGMDGKTVGAPIRIDYERPFNPGDALSFNPSDLNGTKASALRAGEFALYDEYNPLAKISVNGGEFFLNFAANEGPKSTLDAARQTDGDDKIFGDLGNDWLIGGSGRDNLYGGWGNDLLNVDDDLATITPDTSASYEDRAFGGAGRDVMIANTGGDRLIDWTGEYNSYLVPFSPYGAATISRSLQPRLIDFLYALSRSDGADFTRATDNPGGDPARNGEPWGELGLVLQKDAAWGDQHGGPADPQPGNSGGARDVLRTANFNSTASQGFTPQVGTFAVVNNRYEVAPATAFGDAISLFNQSDVEIPGVFEMQATINALKPTGGNKANAYLIFDWQSNDNFKFAGINISTNKLEIGHYSAGTWFVDNQTNAQLKAGTDYVVLLSVSGTAVKLTQGITSVSYTFAARIDSFGLRHSINDGVVGIASTGGTKAQIDDVVVQSPPKTITLDKTVDFSSTSPASQLFTQPKNTTGAWATSSGRFNGTAASAAAPAVNLIGTLITPGSLLDITTTLKTGGQGGIVFDYHGPTYYKFVTLSADTNQLLIGYVKNGTTVIVRSVSISVSASKDYNLGVSLRGNVVNASINGAVVASTIFNETLTDGGYGLISLKGATSAQTSFDLVRLKTDDAAYGQPAAGLVAASAAPASVATATARLTQPTQADLDGLVAEAKRRIALMGLDAAALARLETVTVQLDDLEGLSLGAEQGNVIKIDWNAAGFGWFVDATPTNDQEFRFIDGILQATSGAATGHMDLLSVISHELGHYAGLEHAESGFMAMSLEAGVRTVMGSPVLAPGPGTSSALTPSPTMDQSVSRAVAGAEWSMTLAPPPKKGSSLEIGPWVAPAVPLKGSPASAIDTAIQPLNIPIQPLDSKPAAEALSGIPRKRSSSNSSGLFEILSKGAGALQKAKQALNKMLTD
ncbi:hypothetical protein [Cyanobium sp. ATX-6F1]|uniref:hypothetical protein n=1 Tax=Cyanobium sp. ATX-6F1 TaxID=3137388 RepID=UPI0039BEA1F1